MTGRTELEKYFSAFPEPGGLSEKALGAVRENAAAHRRRRKKGVVAACCAAAACAVLAVAVPAGVRLFSPIKDEANGGADPAPGTGFAEVYPGEGGPEGENALAPAGWGYYEYAYGEDAAARFFAYGVPAFVSDSFSAETYVCGYYVEGELALAHWDVGFGFVLSFARAENDALYFAGESANVAGTVLYTNGAEGAYLYAFEYGGLYYYFESGAPLSEEIEAFLENG